MYMYIYIIIIIISCHRIIVNSTLPPLRSPMPRSSTLPPAIMCSKSKLDVLNVIAYQILTGCMQCYVCV